MILCLHHYVFFFLQHSKTTPLLSPILDRQSQNHTAVLSACWADSRLGHELVLIDEIDEGDTFFEEDLKHAVYAFIGDTLLELWSYNTMLYTH